MNLRLLQISDSALPVGGYTHSWGLEAAISRGLVHDAAAYCGAGEGLGGRGGYAGGCRQSYLSEVEAFGVKQARSRKALLLTVAVLASCAGLLASAPALFRYFDPLDARPFDPAAWAAADAYDRAAMARDAIRHLPPGTPEAEVERLLGPGRVEDSKWYPAPGAAARTYCYHLGGGWAFYYDSTFLWVHVGADGRVIEAVIGGG